MVSVGLEFDLSQVKELQNAISGMGVINKTVLPKTSAAFEASGELTKRYLANYFSGGKLNGIRSLTDKEISILRGVKVKSEMVGDFSSKVSTNNDKPDKLQNGTKSVDYDMKKTHPMEENQE